jgi:hypothetical protein
MASYDSVPNTPQYSFSKTSSTCQASSSSASSNVSQATISKNDLNDLLHDLWGTYDPHTVDDDEEWTAPDCQELNNAPQQKENGGGSQSGPLVLNGSIVKSSSNSPTSRRTLDCEEPSASEVCGPTLQYESGTCLFTEHIFPDSVPSSAYDEVFDGTSPALLDPYEAVNTSTLMGMHEYFEKGPVQANGEHRSDWNLADVHHFNFFGDPAFGRNFNNPIYSLRFILKGTTHIIEDHSLRQGVLLSNILGKIDPVCVHGSMEEILCLNASNAEQFFRQMCGRVFHYYAPYGQWPHDQLDEDDYRPYCDEMAMENYKNIEENGNTIFNGWYQTKSSLSFTITDFWQTTSVNVEGRKPRGWDSYFGKKNLASSGSHLHQSMTCTDEDLQDSSSSTSEEGKVWSSSDDGESTTASEEGHFIEDAEMVDIFDEVFEGGSVRPEKSVADKGDSSIIDEAKSIESLTGTDDSLRIQEVKSDESEDSAAEKDDSLLMDEVTPVTATTNDINVPEPTPAEATSAQSTTMADQSKVKAKPYWTQMRTQTPLKAVENPFNVWGHIKQSKKPVKKHSLGKSIKKAAWKLVPWALRPPYAS